KPAGTWHIVGFFQLFIHSSCCTGPRGPIRVSIAVAKAPMRNGASMQMDKRNSDCLKTHEIHIGPGCAGSNYCVIGLFCSSIIGTLYSSNILLSSSWLSLMTLLSVRFHSWSDGRTPMVIRYIMREPVFSLTNGTTVRSAPDSRA